MGRKTIKKQLREKEETFLTVAKLIEHLKTLDPSLYIGVVGHFGEFWEMDLYDFSMVRESYITPSGSWRDDNRKTVKVLDLICPHIGPDPD